MTLAPNDTDLLLRLQQGEEAAFALIYKRYVKELMRYVSSRISIREDAEEMVQEVFVSLWARHAKLHDAIVLRAYLFASVKYMMIRYISKNKTKQKYQEYFKRFEAIYYELSVEEHDPEIDQALMERGLNALPERCQEAVRLRLTENLSNSEIAERMQIGKSTVENYMVSAVKEMRILFKKLRVEG